MWFLLEGVLKTKSSHFTMQHSAGKLWVLDFLLLWLVPPTYTLMLTEWALKAMPFPTAGRKGSARPHVTFRNFVQLKAWVFMRWYKTMDWVWVPGIWYGEAWEVTTHFDRMRVTYAGGCKVMADLLNFNCLFRCLYQTCTDDISWNNKSCFFPSK